MSIALVCQNKDLAPWRQALTAAAPDIEVQLYPHETAPERVQFALCWNHPRGALQRYPNLRCICSMGAGVDDLLADPDLPTQVPIIRLVDPSLAQSMYEYLCAGIFYYLRELDTYRQQQRQNLWQQHRAPAMADTTIGIMGLGQLGGEIATRLAALGFNVKGWSASGQGPAGLDCYRGDQLQAFAAQCQILVCLLPLTAATRGILNASLFRQLPRGACVINVGRGDHLVEADLLAALDSQWLRGACLDVFSHEPLDPDHPFWQHPQVLLTPHSSSLTDPVAVAPQVIDNYRRMQQHQPLLNRVDIQRGY